MARRARVVRQRLLAAGAAVALGAAGFALAGKTGAAPPPGTDLTFTDVTSLTESLPTSVTTVLPTTVPSVSVPSVTVATTKQPKKPPPRKNRRRTGSTPTSTAAATAVPSSTTTAPARRTVSFRPRPSTIAAAAQTDAGFPGWAIVGLTVGGALIAIGLGGLYATRIRRR